MKIRIALLQIGANKLDQKSNMQKADLYCRKAKESGADIILFPEMYNIGYESFDDTVWDKGFDPLNISDSMREKIRRWNANAVDEDSEFIRHFKQLAKELDTAICITFLQKGKDKPFNSLALIDRKGNIILNYSKVHTCDFSMEYFCEPGGEFRVCELETKNGNVMIGAMICFDREYPESARELMLKGAEIILIPNCCKMDSHRTAQLRTRAFENMTAVALANYPIPKCNGRSQAFSPVVYDENENYVDNLITMADGNEGIHIADFDLDSIRAFRQKEVWGNAYRKVGSYTSLMSEKKEEPFMRKDSRK